MILCTVGTNGAPFDRLLRAVAEVDVDEELIVQHGPSSIRPARATCFEFLPFGRLTQFVQDARVVVTHAGVGSILVALTNGRRPVVVPRLSRYGEAVDDHQLELARRLDLSGLVTLAEDLTALGGVLSKRARDGNPPVGDSALVGELAAYLGPPRGTIPLHSRDAAAASDRS